MVIIPYPGAFCWKNRIIAANLIIASLSISGQQTTSCPCHRETKMMP
jgi:hypothetical protein